MSLEIEESAIHSKHLFGGIARGTQRDMIVFDSDPLIVLFKIKLLFILKEVYHAVLVLRADERKSRKKPEKTLFQ